MNKLYFGSVAVAIDIGTTTISACVIGLCEKKQLESFCVPNAYSLKVQAGFDQQDANAIIAKATELLDGILAKYPAVCVIGLTGQMHGIVYLDENGKAVSPLTTWRDKRGDRLCADGMTYCEKIRSITGRHTASGFGLVTHYYNIVNGLVPADAKTFCSIMDYLAVSLTGRKVPLMHTSNAAGFGLFDGEKGAFMEDAICALGMDTAVLPEVTGDYATLGTYKNIPVAVAIGDNQASFLGSVKNPENDVLINFGTGSQISLMSSYCKVAENLELRPLVQDQYLICGSALAGGYAYAILENFFRRYMTAATGEEVSQYDMVNALAKTAYEQGIAPLDVETTFCGTRLDPNRRGVISGVSNLNFTPEALSLGVIHGICRELYDLLGEKTVGKSAIIASGGAVQRNPVLQKVISDMFGLPLILSTQKEEAATGAALFAAVAAGKLTGIADFADFIYYKN